MKKRIIPITLLISLTGFVHADEKRSLIEAFSQCDSTFVTELYQQQIINDHIIQSPKDKIATFLVKDRNNADENTLFFEEPVKDQDLSITGYYDSVTDLSNTDMGKYYFWGIYLDQSMDDLKKYLSQYEWKGAGNLFFTNGQAYNVDLKQWEAKPSIQYGVPPEKGIERLLAISEDRGKTILTCSIQGDVSDRILIKYRPELFIHK